MKGTEMKKRKVYLILALIMTAFIFYSSAQPAVESAKSSGKITASLMFLLTKIGIRINADFLEVIIRKTAHFAEFFLQSVFIAKSFTGRYRNRIVYVLFFGLLTACTDEYIQLFFDGRAGMVEDIILDFCGTAVGTAVCGIFRRRR